MLFVVLLMTSFCLTENECCTSNTTTNQNFAIGSCYGTCVCYNDCKCNGGGVGDCKCDGGGEAALCLLIFVVILVAIIAIFFAVRACGKHISRLFSVGVLFLLYIGMSFMSLYMGENTYYYLIGAFSFIGAIYNF
mgnify:CR=1 FL=1